MAELAAHKRRGHLAVCNVLERARDIDKHRRQARRALTRLLEHPKALHRRGDLLHELLGTQRAHDVHRHNRDRRGRLGEGLDGAERHSARRRRRRRIPHLIRSHVVLHELRRLGERRVDRGVVARGLDGVAGDTVQRVTAEQRDVGVVRVEKVNHTRRRTRRKLVRSKRVVLRLGRIAGVEHREPALAQQQNVGVVATRRDMEHHRRLGERREMGHETQERRRRRLEEHRNGALGRCTHHILHD